MGVVEAILIILALKIPIVGLLFWVYILMKEPNENPEPDTVRAKLPPRLPEPGDAARPRKRGPHGGAARPLPSPRRDPHPAVAPRYAPAMREAPTPPESVPGPPSRST
ncbi:MAG TPA: hypothetical protein VHA76_13850 [Solirubrobacterales bacterium]|nr:hypothetical protein [Solirubrobacterales bacterium]